MKALLGLLLLFSFSAIAAADIPCDEGQDICEARPWRDAVRLKRKTIYSRGVALSYAKAEEKARHRLYSTYKGISCGIGVPVPVTYEEFRLRDGRMATEVWIKCTPESDSFGSAPRGQRKGVCIGCGSGKGGVIITGPGPRL